MSFCIKCGVDAVVVPRLKDGFCRECFLAYTVHKFRASIGKAKLVRDDEHVLVAYSTGASSTCLLHLIQEGVSRRAQKRLRFHSTVAFIDESIVVGESIDDQKAIVDHAASAVRQSQFPGIFAHLEDSLKIAGCQDEFEPFQPGVQPVPQIGTEVNDDFDSSTFISCDEDKKRFACLMDSLESLSAKEDLIRILRYRLLMALAERCGCTKVASADTSSRMAITFLSDLARGRGAHASFNMGFSDLRRDDIQFFRPLKDFTRKEVAFYNRLNELESRVRPSITTMAHEKASIERLCQEFVNSLQADYSSTVPNIVRTGEKLEASQTSDNSGTTTTTTTSTITSTCSLCQCRLDTAMPAASAFHSLDASTNLRYPPRESTITHAGLPVLPDLASLCYGCRVIAAESDRSSGFLRHFVTPIPTRERIQEYILTDQSDT